jgi:RNA polymerase nonessential primary-like sigma factor
MNQTRTVRLPIHVVKEINIYLRAARKLSQTLDREPTSQDVADMLDQPIDDVKRMLGLYERETSVDSPSPYDPDKSLLDTLPDEQNLDPSLLLQNSDVREHIDTWLSLLTDKQCAVVEHRFGLHGREVATLEEIGNELGVTRERVRQIQIEALKRLKQILLREGFSLDTLNMES